MSKKIKRKLRKNASGMNWSRGLTYAAIAALLGRLLTDSNWGSAGGAVIGGALGGLEILPGLSDILGGGSGSGGTASTSAAAPKVPVEDPVQRAIDNSKYYRENKYLQHRLRAQDQQRSKANYDSFYKDIPNSGKVVSDSDQQAFSNAYVNGDFDTQQKILSKYQRQGWFSTPFKNIGRNISNMYRRSVQGMSDAITGQDTERTEYMPKTGSYMHKYADQLAKPQQPQSPTESAQATRQKQRRIQAARRRALLTPEQRAVQDTLNGNDPNAGAVMYNPSNKSWSKAYRQDYFRDRDRVYQDIKVPTKFTDRMAQRYNKLTQGAAGDNPFLQVQMGGKTFHIPRKVQSGSKLYSYIQYDQPGQEIPGSRLNLSNKRMTSVDNPGLFLSLVDQYQSDARRAKAQQAGVAGGLTPQTADTIRLKDSFVADIPRQQIKRRNPYNIANKLAHTDKGVLLPKDVLNEVIKIRNEQAKRSGRPELDAVMNDIELRATPEHRKRLSKLISTDGSEYQHPDLWATILDAVTPYLQGRYTNASQRAAMKGVVMDALRSYYYNNNNNNNKPPHIQDVVHRFMYKDRDGQQSIPSGRAQATPTR